MSGWRLPHGGRIDRSRALRFTFDGEAYAGHPGDTVASALMASGVRLVGRSFKYHRPRGVFSAGAEEPSALATLVRGEARLPNLPATTLPLSDGLIIESQNRWPRLDVDFLAVNGWLAPLFSAGFYYKTFMWPSSFGKGLRAADPARGGIGQAVADPGRGAFEAVHAHADVLVVGGGLAGLAAARAAAERGRRVILTEREEEAGGAALVDPALGAWGAAMDAALASAGVRRLTRTALVGIYDSGVALAIERIDGDPLSQRLHVIRAQEIVLATGAQERLIAFPDNDRPGVMLATAARAYVNRHGVAPGREAAFFVTNDEAYAAVRDLHAAGVAIAAVVDPRGPTAVSAEAREAGLPVLFGHVVSGVGGRRLSAPSSSARLAAAPSGASPAICFASPGLQSAHRTRHSGRAQDRLARRHRRLRGHRERQSQGRRRGGGRIRPAGSGGGRRAGFWRPGRCLGLPAPPRRDGPMPPLWEVKGKAGLFSGKAFVDLQHDVTTDDMRLAAREGYVSAEHAKRYTTHGMGTDQGKTGGLVGAAILAAAQGRPVSELGVSRPRPFAEPVSWGALAGAETGAHFKPERKLPLHDWHAANGAVFVKIGLWLRPLVYSPTGDTSWGPVLEEARAVRSAVGITDVSSLGKIDVQGPDAARFLDLIYANTFSTLPVGKARYGLMLREDGVVLDDGTTSRLAEDRFFVTTTTAKATEALEHLEFHAQCVWPELDVQIVNVADHWAQFAVAGPQARATLAAIVDRDLSSDAFPFMAAGAATIAGVPGRLFRISFSGEPAYEVSVPAGYALRVWEAILEAGRAHGIRPYGLDALNVMRIEKGHVAGSELNGQTTAEDLGLGKMLKKKGDFVGRHLVNRPGLTDPNRLQLVGLHPLDAAKRLRNGAHLVSEAEPKRSQGYLTAACMSVIHEGWIGLALLEGGHARHGERLVATSPVHGESVPVEVVSPHRFDPENAHAKA